MIPQAFEYSAPSTLQEALNLLKDGERKILAGGMSLIPLMKLRLAQPEHVVDLGRVPGLNQITESEIGRAHV
jgi:carbon-monoxide dehydrogenase medium subunit